jgi:hypothetical protein
MASRGEAVEHLDSLHVYELARRAMCLRPDSDGSAGADFLRRVRDNYAWLVITGQDADKEAMEEIVKDAPSPYHNSVWAEFADLGAYDEPEMADLGRGDDAARSALRPIARRLVKALSEEVKRL